MPIVIFQFTDKLTPIVIVYLDKLTFCAENRVTIQCRA